MPHPRSLLPRLLLTLTATGLLALAPTTATAAQSTTDEVAIHGVLADYVRAWREGDVEVLKRVLAENGRVMWVNTATEGEETLSSMEFRVVLQHRPPQPQYGLQWDVQSLEVIDGELAVAKVSISRQGGSYLDVLVLQKIAGRWRIVSKTFVVRSDPAVAPAPVAVPGQEKPRSGRTGRGFSCPPAG